ncbi:type VII secretion target [Rhodococcus sp. NPDC058521]|uniref:type VII secretion target n=1 Tax=Rhodococcus sp. NPDC058521 TaxID=3346536 RepID=UPI00365D7B26
MKVDPAALDAFATSLSELSAQAKEATDFLEKHVSTGAGDGRIFLTIDSTISDMRALLVANTDGIAKLAGESGQEITRAAGHYRSTDLGNASQLDRTY